VNSILTSLVSAIIAIIIAYGLAWAVTRTNIKIKALFSIIIVLPMLIPSISHGMGLIILFGNNGIITRLLGASSFLYGYVGIILGSLLYSVPIAYLMFVDILKYENYQAYEAADVLRIPRHRQFLSITLQ
jgi:iron(III) transport system permease protein